MNGGSRAQTWLHVGISAGILSIPFVTCMVNLLFAGSFSMGQMKIPFARDG